MSDFDFIEHARIVGEQLAKQFQQGFDEHIWPGIQQSIRSEIARSVKNSHEIDRTAAGEMHER